MNGRSRFLWMIVTCCATSTTLVSSSSRADKTHSLRERIDRLVESRRIGPVAERCDDPTFARRVYLDLLGRIPTLEETKEFLSDPAADKRERLVDRLLDSPECDRHLAVQLDLLLMERRGGKHVKSKDFRSFLLESLRDDRSYLDIVRTILAADGTDEKTRAAAAFYLERDVEPHALTRDVGRIFFGVDLQCAQCHNHPLVDDYHQSDYYGLHAYFVRASLFRPNRKKPAVIAERATGESDFRSVFTDRTGRSGPRFPGGSESAETSRRPQDRYRVEPAKNVRPIPQVSRLSQLAESLTAGPSTEFNRTAANRLWAMLFGRGLVDPVDLHHSRNPACYPKLLELIGAEFANSGYDIKGFLGELAKSRVYQRSFQIPTAQPNPSLIANELEAAKRRAKELSEKAEQADAGLAALVDKLDEALAAAEPLRKSELEKLNQAADSLKKRDAANAKVASRKKEFDGQETKVKLIQDAVTTTKAASEAIKDPELSAALSTLQKKAADFGKRLEEIKKARDKEQAAAETAESTLRAHTQEADKAIAARKPLEAAIRAERAKLLEAREKAAEWWTKSTNAQREVRLLQAVVDFEQARGEIVASQRAIAASEARIVKQEAAMTAVRTSLNPLEAKRHESQAEVEKLRKQHDRLSAEHRAAKKHHHDLAAAIDQVAHVREKNGDLEHLADAVPLLQTGLAKLTANVDRRTKALAAHERLLRAASATLQKREAAWKQARQQLATMEASVTKEIDALARKRTSLASQQSTAETHWNAVIDQSVRRFNACDSTPLTPEQFATSILVATGQYDVLRKAAITKLDNESPAPEKPSAGQRDERDRKLEKAASDAVDSAISTFVRLYGAEPGQLQSQFFATAEQSLFLSNGTVLQSWLAPTGDNLTARLLNQKRSEDVATELYLSVLSRPATKGEAEDVGRYLESRPEKERSAAIQELCWGLLTSSEFRFRH
ncbi:Chromosome partition protein Smc [Planctomycetes bacterium Pan216]|uniref:Chromosome partition protein Smc n=1 Tax=Kolteria novifilia TaxID=2527975 RepID=A0A518AZT7_9BACT|nr:Chromosome partition protein Smc [Planctomycetes bacterium Pan216]